jgi:class 3 adenylate cyclase
VSDEGCTAEEIAERAGVDAAFVRHLADLHVIGPEVEGRYPVRDARRVKLVAACETAGLPAEGIATALERDTLSLAPLDEPYYERWADRATETYTQVGARLGVDVEFLCDAQVALGFPRPQPEDHPRTDELETWVVIAVALQQIPRDALLRLLAVYGTGVRRIATAETQIWHEFVDVPHQRAGSSEKQLLEAGVGFGSLIMPLMDRSLLAMYHRMQEGAWMADLVEHVENALEQAGVHERLARPPAMAFMDLSGYTALTEERGDEAAAELIGSLSDLVLRTATHHGGQPVKFLGDGVMFHFADPGQAVLASLELVERAEPAGLPPAHVGVHAGPIVQRDGDYYGRTVNWASRISGRAAPREVLVTSEVVEHAAEVPVAFDGVGATELKGIARPVELFRALRR